MPLKTSWVRICMTTAPEGAECGGRPARHRQTAPPRATARDGAASWNGLLLDLQGALRVDVLEAHFGSLLLVVGIGVDDALALDLAEDRDVGGDRLVVGLRERLVVGRDDAVDRRLQVLERGLDLRPFGRARLLDRGGEQVDRVVALRRRDRRIDAAVLRVEGLEVADDERLALRRG